MGHTIALSAIWAGFNVTMTGTSQDELEQGTANTKAKLSFLADNDVLHPSKVDDIMQRLSTSLSLQEAVDGATIVFEAVPENLELKKKIYKELDSICDHHVILASNTSGLSPTDIASDTKHPERVLVAHFWNPAHLIPLVEVVPGKNTNNQAIQRIFDVLYQMRKKPIEVKKDISGFIGNRLQYALFREAQHLLEIGAASKEDIDAAVTYSIGRRLPVTGPFMTADLGGLDVFSSISDYLFSDLSDADESLHHLKNLVHENKLGEKTGEGFYDWENDFSENINQEREKELIHFMKQDLKQS